MPTNTFTNTPNLSFAQQDVLAVRAQHPGERVTLALHPHAVSLALLKTSGRHTSEHCSYTAPDEPGPDKDRNLVANANCPVALVSDEG
ncbi:MAG: hypothetical protein ACYCXW_13695 [Solirubrobacteraceae bacterium]